MLFGLALLWTACEEEVLPPDPHEYPYSMWGVLDALNDTQFVRVFLDAQGRVGHVFYAIRDEPPLDPAFQCSRAGRFLPLYLRHFIVQPVHAPAHT
ncbi:MAG TPA: hypothetical protein VKP65_18840 [Rhodothermales bacterium]|nr:hypothetical protein [Rhodothermales bacterium]